VTHPAHIVDAREAVLFEEPLGHEASAAALAVENDLAALVSKLADASRQLLDGNVEGAFDVPTGELPSASDIDEHRPVCDQSARVGSGNPNRSELLIEHEYDDGGQDAEDDFRNHGPKDSPASRERQSWDASDANAAWGRKAR